MSADQTNEPSKGKPIRWWVLGLYLAVLAAIRGATFVLPLARDARTVVGYGLFWLALLGSCLWLALQSRLSIWLRLGAVGVAVAAVGVFSQIDIINDGDSRTRGWRWVWEDKPDELLPPATPVASVTQWQPGPYDYPRFLGTGFWAEAPDVGLAIDWESQPPELLWKQPIGAGWSAFAIVGDYAVTQEQRGEEELVTCYEVLSGALVWKHAEAVRFDEYGMRGLGGIGPRATPTIHNGRVYTQGSSGILLCLDAADGSVIWRHAPQENEEVANLQWAKSNSPLVLADRNQVIIPVGPPTTAEADVPLAGSVVALDADSGDVVWSAGDRVPSYASPVRATVAGVDQLLMVEEDFATGYSIDDGAELWQVTWPGSSSADANCSQPIPLSGDRILLTKGYGVGTKMLRVARDGNGTLDVEEIWKRSVLKTKFSNVVIHDGYAYGLDEIVLQCVDLESGQSKWKKRRRPEFGHGQVLLIGDLLFVLTELGEGILVRCNPEKYEELAAMQMITDKGITWNNPALAGDVLLVRNDLEAAAYRLPRREPSEDEVEVEAEAEAN